LNRDSILLFMKPKNVYELLAQRAQELGKELFMAELSLRKAEEYPGVTQIPNRHIAYYQTEITIIERLQNELD